MVIKVPKRKLKAKLARNTIFEGNWDEIFAHFGSKIAKSVYFRGFTLVGQSVSHILGIDITSVFLRD